MGQKRVRQPKSRGKPRKQESPRPPPDSNEEVSAKPLKGSTIPKEARSSSKSTNPVASQADAIQDANQSDSGERNRPMFRTIKKNLLTPLLPKSNEAKVEKAEAENKSEAAPEKAEQKPRPMASEVVSKGPNSTAPVPQKAVQDQPLPPEDKPKVASRIEVGENPTPAPNSPAPDSPALQTASEKTVREKVVSDKVVSDKAASEKAAKPTNTKPKPERKSEEKKAPTGAIPQGKKEINMANINASMDELMRIDGATGVAVVDIDSGMALGTSGGAGLNLEVAAAGNSEVVKSKLKVKEALGLKDSIEDILITLDSQYHLIRPLTKANNLFIYLVLNRKNSNLAMARHKLASIEGDLQV